eukprot:scaffold10760_cov237-Skeletonema_marinoi.AAC.1
MAWGWLGLDVDVRRETNRCACVSGDGRCPSSGIFLEIQEQDRCVSQVGVRLGCARLVDLLEVQGTRYMYMLLRFIHIELIIKPNTNSQHQLKSTCRVNIYTNILIILVRIPEVKKSNTPPPIHIHQD